MLAHNKIFTSSAEFFRHRIKSIVSLFPNIRIINIEIPNYCGEFTQSNSRHIKGIDYPESANFPILLFYAYNEAVCV